MASKLRMWKPLLWTLNGLLTLGILASVGLFLLKKSAQADVGKELDDIAREVQAKARKTPVRTAQNLGDYQAIWALNVRDLPTPEPQAPDTSPLVAKVTPLDDIITSRAIVGPTVVIEYKNKKDAAGQQLQLAVDLGKEVPDLKPAATLVEILPNSLPERVKYRYAEKEVFQEIKRDINTLASRSPAPGLVGKKGKNGAEGEPNEEEFAGTAGQVPGSGRVPPTEEELKETREIRPGIWQLSAEERDRIKEGARDILEEVEVSSYMNERTKRADGMKVESIQESSLLRQRGLQEGDLVKKVNGTPVNSKTDVVNYVRDNQDHLQVVRVEIERKGKTMTLEYRIPK